METINIQQFLGEGSKIFSGRPTGIRAREIKELNKKDMDELCYEVIIPEGVYSINGSFFGGMFSDSVKRLGEEKFNKKYHFKFKDKELNITLKKDIDDGIYDALNDL